MPRTTSIKKWFYILPTVQFFTYESRATLESFSFVSESLNSLGQGETIEIKKRKLSVVVHVTFSGQRRILSFRVFVLQRMAKKCTKNYNVRAEPLFCSLHLLFSDAPVAVAVVVFLNFLIRCNQQSASFSILTTAFCLVLFLVYVPYHA